ncbi:MAG: hypothetical protein CMJ76_06675 [Planctomycetaceae bacterium]|nr:hypothetical protein [Planctomycetaceae bacterium]
MIGAGNKLEIDVLFSGKTEAKNTIKLMLFGCQSPISQRGTVWRDKLKTLQLQAFLMLREST